MALNKIDVPDGRDLADIVLEDFEARGLTVLPVSAASHEGLRELSFAMAEIVAAQPRARSPPSRPTRIVIRPPDAPGGPDFTVKQTGEGWRVRGEQARALGPADRLHQRRGRRLPRRPAQPARRRGPAARARAPRRATPSLIGAAENAVVFDFKPMVDAGRRAARQPARRGRPPRGDRARRAAPPRRSTRRMPTRGEDETRADVARRLGVTDPDATADDRDVTAGRPATGAGRRTTPRHDRPEDEQ